MHTWPPILLLALLPTVALATDLVITGQVFDEQGRPLSGVRATLLDIAERPTTPDRGLDSGPPGDAAVATSDATGAFRLAAPTDGLWTVRIEAEGHVPLEHLLGPLREAAELPGAQLRRGRIVKLRVLDRAHRPVRARIDVERPTFEGPGDRSIAWQPAPEWLETDVEGRVRLTIDKQERRRLEVIADGFVARSLELDELPTGEGSAELEIILDPTRTAVGQVIDAGDSPVPGARVLLNASDPGSRQSTAPCMGSADAPSSDAEGWFTVADLMPGSYRLMVCAAGFAPVAVPGIVIPPAPMPHGSSAHSPVAGAIDVGAVDVGTVVLVPGAVIAGRIVDADGEPLADAVVRVLPGRLRATSHRDGSFELGDLQPGQIVDLRVDLDGFARRTLPDVTAPTVDPLEIILEPTGEVAGWVVDAGGVAVADAEVSVLPEASDAGVATGRPATGRSGDDGSFGVAGVAPGRATLTAEADGYLSARLAGIEVPPAGMPEAIELVLERAATVAGRVSRPGGEPLAGVTVRVVEAGGSAGISGSKITGDEGRFSFRGLPPGPSILAAEHRNGQRVAEAFELHPGDNQVQLVLAVSGVDVAGRVYDATASGVAGARVELRDENGSRRLSATSAAGGSFAFAEVPPGVYTLSAREEGSGSGQLEGIEVRDAAVAGLEVRLEAGTTLSGRTYGLEFDELARVEVRASAHGLMRQAGLDFEGSYKISHLEAGRWRVRAEVPGTGLQAAGEVTLEPGMPATLDLDFNAGYALSGRAVQGEAPVASATISLSGLDVAHHARASSDHRGAFRVGGLPAGTYRLVLTAGGGRLRHTEEVDVNSDRELLIDLTTGGVAGRVIDTGGAAIAGARVTLRPAGGAGPGSRGGAVVSDSEGRFDLASVDAGSWRLAASRKGYATATETLELGIGEVVVGLVLELEPAAGVSFAVAAGGATAGIPTEVRFAVLDARGESVAGGSAAILDGGRVELRTVPAGRWELLLRAAVPGAGTLRVAILAPGELGTLALPAAGTLRLRLAELEGDPMPATVTLIKHDGRPHRSVGAGGTVHRQWSLHAGRATIPNVPAGLLTVRVDAADGRSWSGSLHVPAAGAAELDL